MFGASNPALHPFSPHAEIVEDFLFLGSSEAARSIAWMKSQGIRAVVNAASNEVLSPSEDSSKIACSRYGKRTEHEGLSALLMKCHNMTFVDALKKVRTARPIAYPNQGFWRALLEFEEELYGKLILPGGKEALVLHGWK